MKGRTRRAIQDIIFLAVATPLALYALMDNLARTRLGWYVW
jgi:hypothetical protein